MEEREGASKESTAIDDVVAVKDRKELKSSRKAEFGLENANDEGGQ